MKSHHHNLLIFTLANLLIFTGCVKTDDLIDDLTAPKIQLTFTSEDISGKLTDVYFNEAKAKKTFFDANANFEFERGETLRKGDFYRFPHKRANVIGEVYRFGFFSQWLKKVEVANRYIKEMYLDNNPFLDTLYIENAQDLQRLSLTNCKSLKALRFSDSSSRYSDIKDINLHHSHQLQNLSEIIRHLPDRSRQSQKGYLYTNVAVSPQQVAACASKGWITTDAYSSYTQQDIQKVASQLQENAFMLADLTEPDYMNITNHIMFYRTRNGYLGKLQFLKRNGDDFIIRIETYTPSGVRSAEITAYKDSYFDLETGNNRANASQADFRIETITYETTALRLVSQNHATFMYEKDIQ